MAQRNIKFIYDSTITEQFDYLIEDNFCNLADEFAKLLVLDEFPETYVSPPYYDEIAVKNSIFALKLDNIFSAHMTVMQQQVRETFEDVYQNEKVH